MRKVEHKDLDKNAWDECVKKSDVENIFMYSWYLDAVSPNWKGLVQGDYEGVFPLTIKTNLSKSNYYQPIFTREFQPLGLLSIEDIINLLNKDCAYTLFRTNESIGNSEERVHQLIDLNEDFKLKTNARRILKKSEGVFTIKEGKNPEDLIQVFKNTAFSKIDSLGAQELERLENLMNSALANNSGILKYIFKENDLVGGAFFLTDKSRITLLKSACTEETKREGAMYQLINSTIQESKSKFSTFDFGGSNVPAVREFYLKFGARDRIYFEVSIGQEPGWKKKAKSLLKKVKRK